MSVVYGKRSLSDMEFWKQMLKLEREVRNSLLHDFGIKNGKSCGMLWSMAWDGAKT